ncbi:hypothetical protein G4B88_003564 [Cannabis sativa]|uniref:Receptor-like serine/threonine-protein kinase n=1 Tax=Cannabis sativa TaxID=3483 RepID=A0A7J6ERD0_CANSA|nr:hypothetical protein G4B88_003564 [Cannabis sativa]
MAANAIIVLFFLLITEILFSISIAQQNNTTKMISLNSSISTSTNNSYWLSNSGQFAFGFYKQGNGFAIGIWLDKIKEKTVVWTANRDQQQPLPQITTLVLNDFANSVSPDQPAASASLLDSGNFVLYNSDSKIIWQSFENPTDTLLPGQILETGKELVSAVSESNHSSGGFILRMQDDGNLVQYPINKHTSEYYSYWDTKTYWKGSPKITLSLHPNGQLELLNSTSKASVYTVHPADWIRPNNNVTFRLTIDVDGILRLYSRSLVQVNSSWNAEWNSTNNRCDPTGLCGMNAYCLYDQHQRPNCTCLSGHDFIDQSQKRLGCERKSKIDYCKSDNHNTVSVVEFNGVLWENNSYSIVPMNNKSVCEQDCLNDCDCEIAIYATNTCNKLRLPLRYAKADQTNSYVVTMVKVLATTTGVTKGRSQRVQIGIFISGIVLSCFGLMALAISIALIFKFRMWEYRKITDQWHHDFLEDVAIRPYKFSELEKATEARGMAYLHEECEIQIIHCDIKPENILMDEQACAKIADFGLSKLLMPDQTRTYTGLRGTRGYWAPEWHRNMPITVKADVYSYGIMLLEIVCCRRSVDMDVPENEVVLANWVYDCFVGGEMRKLVHEEDVESNELKKMIKLGLWCIQHEPSLRPSMKKVCMMLEGIVDIPTPPIPSSSISHKI